MTRSLLKSFGAGTKANSPQRQPCVVVGCAPAIETRFESQIMIDKEPYMSLLKSRFQDTDFHDKECYLALLKITFQDSNFHIDVVDLSIQKYESMTDHSERDTFLLFLWNASLVDRWAWDVLIELCRRTKFDPERPGLLNDFAVLLTIGDRRPPDKKRGHPKNKFNSDWKIYLTVKTLVEDCSFSKSDAYDEVSEWSAISEENYLEPDTIRKIVGRVERRGTYSFPKMVRK